MSTSSDYLNRVKEADRTILERAIKRVIEKLKFKQEKGHFTDGDAWMLGYLEEALEWHNTFNKGDKTSHES